MYVSKETFSEMPSKKWAKIDDSKSYACCLAQPKLQNSFASGRQAGFAPFANYLTNRFPTIHSIYLDKIGTFHTLRSQEEPKRVGCGHKPANQSSERGDLGNAQKMRFQQKEAERSTPGDRRNQTAMQAKSRLRVLLLYRFLLIQFLKIRIIRDFEAQKFEYAPLSMR